MPTTTTETTSGGVTTTTIVSKTYYDGLVSQADGWLEAFTTTTTTVTQANGASKTTTKTTVEQLSIDEWIAEVFGGGDDAGRDACC
jgi:hypothetical protein